MLNVVIHMFISEQFLSCKKRANMPLKLQLARLLPIWDQMVTSWVCIVNLSALAVLCILDVLLISDAS
jgi:hypothetical protein